jgi:Carbohydrate-binding module 48 (Isoamylase N-terminal domain)
MGAIPGPARAQATAWLEGGGSRVTYQGADGLSAVSVTPGLELLGSRGSVSASGNFAQFDGGGWSFQGGAEASLLTPAFGPLRAELAGGGTGSTYRGGGGAGQLLGRARLHWLGATAGLWAGGGAGRSWNGLRWQGVGVAEAAAWYRRGPLTLVAGATPVWIGDSLRLVDTEGTIRVDQGALELTATGGFRQWGRPSNAAGTSWGSGSGAFWLGPHVAVVVAGGSYPADFAQGLPSASYVSLGLRLATRHPVRTRAGTAPAEGERGYGRMAVLHRAPVPAFEVMARSSTRRTFRVLAPAAHRIEVMGDFSQWTPVALEARDRGWWEVTLPLGPGTYRMNLRVDGGPWLAPPGMLTIADEFGGVVGLLRVK